MKEFCKINMYIRYIMFSNINLLVILVLSILFIVLIYFNRTPKKEQFNAYYKDKQKVGTNEMDRGNQPKSTWKSGNLNYESCYNTNTRFGNSIPRKNTFFCDFGNEGEIVPINGTYSLDFVNYNVYYQKIIKGKRLQGSHTLNGVSITFDEFGRPIGQIMTLQQSKDTCDNLKDKCIGFIIQSNDNGNKNAATFFVAALEPGFEDPNVYDHIFVTPEERSKEQSSLTSYQNYTSYIKKDVKYVEKPVKELIIPNLEAPTQCNWKDTSSCIFKDYTKSGNVCRVIGNDNPAYSGSGLQSYNSGQLESWLQALYNRNLGSDRSRGEAANVYHYWNTCKNTPGYEFLQKLNFTKP